MKLFYYFIILWFLILTVMTILSIIYDTHKSEWSDKKVKHWKIYRRIFDYMLSTTLGVILLIIFFTSDRNTFFATTIQRI